MGCMFAQFVAMVRCEVPAALRHRSTTLVRVNEDFIVCMLMSIMHENYCHNWKEGRHCDAPKYECGQPPDAA